MGFFFKTPFAFGGDKTAIPLATQPDGSVSYNVGFGVKYQEDPGTTGLNIPRNQFNELMFEVTNLLNKYQTQAFPDFITAADNGGAAYSYSANAYVRSGGIIYFSLVDSNTDTPPSAKWSAVSYSTATELTGVSKQYWGSALPSGYVWANGTTIGDVSSGATGRANADTLALYTLLWNSLSNTVLPIQTSGGVATTRGSSAAVDFGAHKRLPVPDLRGRLAAGVDNMGGIAAANRITSAGSSIAGTTLGAAGGTENVSLTGNQNGAHAHSGTTNTANAHSHYNGIASSPVRIGDVYGVTTNEMPGTAQYLFDVTANPVNGVGGTSQQGGTSTVAAHSHTFSTDSAGLGTAHLNVQPTIMANYILKL